MNGHLEGWRDGGMDGGSGVDDHKVATTKVNEGRRDEWTFGGMERWRDGRREWNGSPQGGDNQGE